MNSSLKNCFDGNNDFGLKYGNYYSRIPSFTVFGYKVKIDIVNTITVVFKLKDSITNKDVIFSFGYFQESNSCNKKEENIAKFPGCNLLQKYFVLGGSFTSKDGEYRNGLLSAENYFSINNYVNHPVEYIKQYLRNKLPLRKLYITKDYFFPTDDKRNIEIDIEYYTYDLQFTLLALTWFNIMTNLSLNIIENNLVDLFQEIMLKHKDEDMEFYNIIIKKYSKEEINKLLSFINYIRIDRNKDSIVDTTKVGQKIIPLSISEAQNPFNIRYKPWREYLISIHLSDVVVNNICPGFFLINQWFYIKNSRKGLFDNEVQFQKMKRSELAEQITILLNRANLYTNENINDITKIKKKTADMIETWISDKFKILSDKIQDPIDYAKEEIIMSNVALCIITEYVGRTIMDVVKLCTTSKYFDDLLGNPFTLKGLPFFKKYMFDLCYNLYCLNYRSGIIHGDLHLNNVTINSTIFKGLNINDIKNPSVLYILGESISEQYLLPTSSSNLCLIDFSRSIILPEKICQLNDISLSKSYDINSKFKEFQEDQVERLLQIYFHFTSDSSHNKDDLKIVFRNKFESVFKLLTVTDIYGFTQKLSAVFNLHEKNYVKPHASVVELVKKLNSLSKKYITEHMNKLITEPAYEGIVIDMEWPIYTILKECFYEFLVNDNIDAIIIDVFNINNKIEFSLTKLEKFPDIITDPKDIINGKITPITDKYYINSIKERELYEKEKKSNMTVINYISQRQIEKHI